MLLCRIGWRRCPSPSEEMRTRFNDANRHVRYRSGHRPPDAFSLHRRNHRTRKGHRHRSSPGPARNRRPGQGYSFRPRQRQDSTADPDRQSDCHLTRNQAGPQTLIFDPSRHGATLRRGRAGPLRQPHRAAREDRAGRRQSYGGGLPRHHVGRAVRPKTTLCPADGAFHGGEESGLWGAAASTPPSWASRS